MPEEESLLSMPSRWRAGCPTREDIDRMARAFQTYHANKGELPLDRCLGLTATNRAWEVSERDSAIMRALSVMADKRAWLRFVALESEWRRFLSPEGPWRRWRDDAEPPATATALQVAFFWMSRYNRGDNLSAKQLKRIADELDKFSR
jgi:hypothetical protein